MKQSRQAPLASLLLWPAVAAAAAGGFAGQLLRGLLASSPGAKEKLRRVDPEWTMPNVVMRELSTVWLRDFSTTAAGIPTLLCAPYALHAANILDLAPGHSVVEALRQGGCGRVFLTDWRSATADMRFFSIDTYLSELNILVDDLGGRVDLVGACQGGWLALIYAARFAHKVRKLVLVAAPVDLAAGASRLSRLAQDTPLAVFQEMVALGEGCMPGDRLLDLWGPATRKRAEIADVLQRSDSHSPTFDAVEARFREWHAATLDLPGTYYLEAVERLFKRNELATGRFVALGGTIDLARVRCPIYLLAARDDDVVVPPQLLAAATLVGTPPRRIRQEVLATGHLGLFMGRSVVAGAWHRVAEWLAEPTRAVRSRKGGRAARLRREPGRDHMDAARA